MTRQQQENELILNSLWNLGERMFDGMLAQITKQVESSEARSAEIGGRHISTHSGQHDDAPANSSEDECELCGGTGEYTLGRSDSDWGEVVKCECAK